VKNDQKRAFYSVLHTNLNKTKENSMKNTTKTEILDKYTEGYIVAQGQNELYWCREEDIPTNSIDFYYYDVEKLLSDMKEGAKDSENKDYWSTIR